MSIAIVPPVSPSYHAPSDSWRWTVTYYVDGALQRKQGRKQVATVARRYGLNTRQAKERARELAVEDRDHFVEELKSAPEATSERYTCREWFAICDRDVWSDPDVNQPNSANNKRGDAERYFLPRFGDVYLDELSRTQLRAWLTWLRTTPFARVWRDKHGNVTKRGAERLLPPKSVANIVGSVSSYLRVAVEDDHIDSNPMPSLPEGWRKTWKAELKKRKVWLSPCQLRELTQRIRQSRYYDVYLIQRDLFVRVGEACGLPLADVDPVTGTATIRQQLKQVVGVGCVEGDPKTDAGVRVVKLSPELLARVLERLDQERIKGALGEKGCKFVAVNRETHERIRPKTYSDWLKGQLIELLGYDPRGQSSHIIRRSSGNIMRRAPGLSAETRTMLMGHKGEQVGDEFYFDLDAEQRHELDLAAEYLWSQVGGD